MEPLSFASFTLAGILSTFPTPGEQVSQAVITTHISPAIAGQWEIELGDDRDSNEQMMSQSQEPRANAYNNEYNNTDNNTDKNAGIVKQNESRMITINPMAERATNLNLSASNNSQCREIYNFGADNEMWAVSGKEWTYGRYLITHREEGLPIIALQTIYDNNEIDCSGNQVDQSDEALIAFLKHQGNRMQWCADPEGQECFMSFNKVLP